MKIMFGVSEIYQVARGVEENGKKFYRKAAGKII